MPLAPFFHACLPIAVALCLVPLPLGARRTCRYSTRSPPCMPTDTRAHILLKCAGEAWAIVLWKGRANLLQGFMVFRFQGRHLACMCMCTVLPLWAASAWARVAPTWRGCSGFDYLWAPATRRLCHSNGETAWRGSRVAPAPTTRSSVIPYNVPTMAASAGDQAITSARSM